jgi:hypothetical protein
MHLFFFLSIFSVSSIFTGFLSQFLLIFLVSTGLDFLFEFQICSISKKIIIFKFLFRYNNCSNSNFCSDSKICSNSKIVQILILFKFDLLFKFGFCSNSIYCSSLIFLFKFDFCSNINLFKFKIRSYSKFV